MEHCFLCGAVNFSDVIAFQCIRTSKVPSSQKSVHVVLTHLAKLIKMALQCERGSKVCTGCFDELSAYDNIMVNLMVAQKKLTQQLKSILSAPQKPLKAETFAPTQKEIEEEEEIPMPTDDESHIDSDDEEEHREDTIKLELEEVNSDDCTIFEVHCEELTETQYETTKKKRTKRQCETCGKEFTSKYQLVNHMNEEHSEVKSYNCPICVKTCKDEEYLELHMNIHEGKTENDCRYCPKRFSRPVNTLRHMRMHWDKKKYQCEKCGVRFSQDHLLYNHRLRHEAEENPIICAICNISFKSRKTYNHHMLIHQENRPRHYCSMCPKSFTERYTLKMHLKTHTNEEHINSLVAGTTENISVVEQVVEELEDDVHETEDAVTVIIENSESDNSGFCVICNFQFPSRKELDNHLQVDHDVVFK